MAWKIVLGVAVVLALGIAAAIVFGAQRWAAGTRTLRGQIEAARTTVRPARFSAAELVGLPAPVARYLGLVLQDGQAMVTAVNLAHVGQLNMSETGADWKPFTSTQRVLMQRPGFDWDARVALAPGLAVHVHDAYVAGQGVLHAAVLGLVNVAEMRDGGELARGELLRWLAEATWYPTALLPSQGVHWEAVDEHAARATLTDGAISVTLLFHFGADGLVDTVLAPQRGRLVGKQNVPAPWQGRFWNYAVRSGMTVPLEGEVTWLLPAGPHTYWRGRVTQLVYETAP